MIKRYKPKIDRLFWLIWIPTAILLIAGTVLSIVEIVAFFLMLAVDVFTVYFMVSSLVGYVELRETSLYVRFGFIIKRDIPYDKIRGFTKDKRAISYSMLSLKNALEHVDIKYNKYDMITVSVIENDELIKELKKRTSSLEGYKVD